MDCKKLVVLTEGADLDSLSSAYAYLKLFKDSYLYKPSYLSRRAGEVFKDFKHLFRITDEIPECIDLLLADVSSLDRLPEDIRKANIRKIYIYDHHKPDIKDYEGRIEEVGSATTLLVEELIKSGAELTPDEATLIALGIYEDTGNFTYAGTTSRDLKACAWLLEKGADINTIRRYLTEAYTKEHIDIVSRILSSIETVYVGKRKIVMATARVEEYKPNLNSLLYEIKELKEADAFFVIIEAGNKTYVFGRSKDRDIDTGKILSVFGGGGHREAGSVKLENVSAERIKNYIVDYIKGEVVPDIRIRDIMTSPPFVVSEFLPVKDALGELIERGFASAPVVDKEGNPVGIVSKKSLLKIAKVFPESPLREFMNSDFKSLSPDDPIWEAEDIVLKYGQKLIPVVDKGNLVGVVTRFDILQHLRRDTLEFKAFKKSVSIPEKIKDVAREIGNIANRYGYKAYLVGGVVRDILLGRDIWDIDVVVEGNAIEVAENFAESKGVKSHSFKEFGTAHLKVDSIKIEFATARKETYLRPGSYPKVEWSSLKNDLVRRDFTINAMAISINEKDFGTLIDFFGGLRDLKDRIIRILHPISFIEDPVRILRALRFAGRFDFKLSRSTERLLIQAVNMGLLEEAPYGRIMNELRLTLREKNIISIFRLYKKYHIFEHIIKGFKWDHRVEEEIFELRKIIDWFSLEFPEEKFEFSWLYLWSILLKISYSEAEEIIKSISAPSWFRKGFNILYREGELMKERLRKAKSSYEVYSILKYMHPSLLLMLMTDKTISDRIRLYLEKLRFIKISDSIVNSLKESGIEGKELGKKIEDIKREIMEREAPLGGK